MVVDVTSRHTVFICAVVLLRAEAQFDRVKCYTVDVAAVLHFWLSGQIGQQRIPP